MGGRGSSSGIGGGESNKSHSGGNSAKLQKQEIQKKMPSFGTKVQENFISYVKKQTNVDLSKARDTQFDSRKLFNIDSRKLGHNDLSKIQNLIRKYDGGYEVSIEDSGAYRKAIYVKRKRKK